MNRRFVRRGANGVDPQLEAALFYRDLMGSSVNEDEVVEWERREADLFYAELTGEPLARRVRPRARVRATTRWHGALGEDASEDSKTLPAEYKRLLDRIASVEDDARKSFGIGGLAGHLGSLRAMRSLAEAVESGDVAASKAAVTSFLEAIAKDSFDPATGVLLGGIPLILVTRVFLLDLPEESKRLQDHFFGKQGARVYQQASNELGFASDFAVWRAIAEEARARARTPTASTAEAAIDTLLRAFNGINRTVGPLDPKRNKQVAKDLDDLRRDAMYASGSSLSLTLMSLNPDRTIGGHYQHLLSLFPPLVIALMSALQTLMDDVIAALEAGSGDAKLETLRGVLEGKLKPAFDFPWLLNISVDVTRSDFTSKRKQHFDFFILGNKSPAVEIQSFHKRTMFFPEKSLTLKRLFEIRAKQVRTLQHLYGFAKDDKGVVTTESAENAAAIKTAGGLKLDDVDSWRAFLLAKLRAAKARGKGEWDRLAIVVGMLGAYLSAFTLHTPYNIDEFGENYLTRKFPRALSGQLIHDCGVYALRIAYAMSLVRKELGLSFRAVALPVHVALVITFDDLSKGACFLNNEQFAPIEAAALQKFIDRWRNTDETGAMQPTAKVLDVEAFLGEVAGATFVTGTDIPYRVEKVPEVPDVKDAGKRHRVLWDFYHDKVIKPPVIVGDEDEPQPELRYLALLEHSKSAYNSLVVPFWAEAFQRHNNELSALTAAAVDVQSGKNAAKRAAGKKVLDAHRAGLLELAKPLLQKAEELERERKQISTFMTEHPKALGPKAKLSPAARLSLAVDWEIRFHAYLGDRTPPGDLSAGNLANTPWARKQQLLEPHD